MLEIETQTAVEALAPLRDWHAGVVNVSHSQVPCTGDMAISPNDPETANSKRPLPAVDRECTG